MTNKRLLLFRPSSKRIIERNYEDFVDLQVKDSSNRFRDPTTWEKLTTPAKITWNWLHSTIHNYWGAYHIVKLMKLKPMEHGIVSKDHPWITGKSEYVEGTIYEHNIIFASPKTNAKEYVKEPDVDADIVNKMGKFLGGMTRKSTGEVEKEQGPKRRMPHVVNYLHGSVSYNGGTLIFNNIKDAMFHLSDPQFVKDIYSFVKAENREFMIVLRDRGIKDEEYAFFLGFVRSHLKWYANANGGSKKILYGGPSSYPIVNVINGNWVKDMNKLRENDTQSVVRPPITENYFTNEYQGNRGEFKKIEEALIYLNYLVIKPRGFQGGLVFTKRSKIEPRAAAAFKEKVENGERPVVDQLEIKNPFE